MTVNVRTAQSGTDSNYDPRPDYYLLGVDAQGAHHVWRPADGVVDVIEPDGGRERYPITDGHPERNVDAWMDHVEDEAGWATRRYGVDVVEQLERALEASD